MEAKVVTLTWEEDSSLLRELRERTGLLLEENAAWQVSILPVEDLTYYGYTREREEEYNPWEE